MDLFGKSVRVTVLAIAALGTSGCGDGGGTIASTPTPTPTPAPAYVGFDALSGNQAFQTASTTDDHSTSPLTTYQPPQAYGSGIAISYNATNQTYTVTGPQGTASYGPADIYPANTDPALKYYVRNNAAGAAESLLTIERPVTPALTYTRIADWRSTGTTGPIVGSTAVLGVPTLANDMPRSGTASYTLSLVRGSVLVPQANGDLYHYQLRDASATLSANFASGAIGTTLNMFGVPTDVRYGPSLLLGVFNGTGMITAGSNAFTGNFARNGSATGVGTFAGAFFGPQAGEYGYVFSITERDAGGAITLTGNGAVVGTR